MNKIIIQKYCIKTNKKINKRICLLSDFHHKLNDKKKLYESIIVKIKNENPDYIIIAGDIVDTGEVLENVYSKKILKDFLIELSKICKTIITLGNHDLKYSNKNNRSNDLTFFNNLNNLENIYYMKNKNIIFNNIEFINYTPRKEWYSNKSKYYFYEEFNKYPIKISINNNYKILIMHSPISIVKKVNFENLSCITNNIDLIVSGHMHNGALPEFLEFLDRKKRGFGIISPSKKLFPLYCRGVHKIDRMKIIISRGIKKIPHSKFLNVFFDKEITIIDLE